MKKNFLLLGTISGAALGAVVMGKSNLEKFKRQEKKIDKFKTYYNVLNEWLRIKQEGKTLAKYFLDEGYKNIAIYGMGELGNRLYDELKESDVVVKYAIDKDAGAIYSDLDVYDIDGILDEVDVVVVTAIFAYDEILEEIEGKIAYPIVSLEDVIFGI